MLTASLRHVRGFPSLGLLSGQLEQDRTPHYVTADEYLSGNVRRKLRQAQRAAQQDQVYAVNVEALTAAQPKDLNASEIEVPKYKQVKKPDCFYIVGQEL